MAKGGSIWRDQLGSLLRTTWQGLDTVRGVVEKKARAGRIQIDVALLKRKRKDALAAMGAVVARLAANGRIDEGEYPELSAHLAKLDALDERIAVEEQRARAAAMGVEAGVGVGDEDGDEAEERMGAGVEGEEAWDEGDEEGEEAALDTKSE